MIELIKELDRLYKALDSAQSDVDRLVLHHLIKDIGEKILEIKYGH